MSSNSSTLSMTVPKPNGGKAGLVSELKTLYEERRSNIRKRLEEFKEVFRKGSEADVFAELSFCLLTPQSSAETCWKAILKLKEKNLLIPGTPELIGEYLHEVRFWENKSRYIVMARQQFSRRDGLQLKQQVESFYSPFERREW